jgi:PKD repeat protein
LNDAAQNVTDATYHAIMGTDIITSTGTTSVTGLIGKARSFSPAQKNAISLGATASICGLTDSITVSGWFKTVQPEDTVVSVLRCDGNFTALQIKSAPGQNAFATYWDPTPHTTGFPWTGSIYADNQWHYVTSKYKTGSGCRVFMDGTLVAGDSANTGVLVASTSSFYLGTSGNMEYYRGLLDEVRVEKSFRSPDWIRLCYQNQRAVQTLVTSIFISPPSNLTYSTNPASYVSGTAIAANTPTSSGGAIASYSVAPALPTGLTLNTSTGVITGTPTTAKATASYTVTATNAAGSTTVSLSITVMALLAPPTNLTYSTNPASYVVGTAITANSPTTSGGAVASYSVAPALPAGLTLSTTTGVITGTPTTAQAAATYTVTARNASGASTTALSIAVTYPQAKAYFKASPVTGKAPLSVTFTDTSSGVVSKRYWYFGDNTAIDSSLSPVHTYTTEGSFTAKLVVFGATGSRADSMAITIRTYKDNPVLISGRLITPSIVEISYANYNVLPTGPLPPFADSIALWYKPGSIPLSSTGATYAKNYLPAAMQSSGKGAPIKDTITLPQPSADSVYGFITAVHWTDGTWSKFAAGNGCLVLTLITNPPATPTIVYPSAGAINVPVSVSFKWHSVLGASTYRLQLSTAANFSAIVKDSSGLTDTSLTLSNLSNNTNYYWCVNATNTVGTSSWSTTSTFITVAGLPGPVLLVSPLDTAKIQSDLVLLVWNKALPAVTKYMVQIATDSGMSHVLLVDSTVTDTSTILMSLTTNTSYWWQVKACNSSGWGPYSPKYKFTIFPISVLPYQRKVRSFEVHYSGNLLRYALPDKCHVSVRYYDVKGRKIASFVNKIQTAGYYTLPICFAVSSEGVYIQVFKAGSFESRATIITVR